MANLNLIQQLKTLTQCSTPQALQLLKQSNDDVKQAEQLFHQQNLVFIQQQAECDRELAEKFYRMYDFDVKKSIENADAWIRNGIYNRSIITTRENKYNENEHALVIYAENEHNQMVRDRELIAKTWVCIPLNAGSELLIRNPNLLGFYDWQHGEYNYFSLADVDKLIKNLDNIKVSDSIEQAFYQELKNWLIECKPLAHHLIFEDLLS